MPESDQEHWRPIVGFEGAYEVSDRGRVRSLPRIVDRGAKGPLPVSGGVLKPQLRDGRLRVSLGSGGPVKVHLLVARAFLGPRPDGYHVCHNNGDPLDNRVENLRYDTKSGNELDKVRHGTHHNANKTHCPHGHEYDAANTYMRNGKRFCRACNTKAGRQRVASLSSRRAVA